MEFRSFTEIEDFIVSGGIRKKIVLCGADDEAALEAVVNAKRAGVADGLLLGDEQGIRSLLHRMEEASEGYEILDMPGEKEASEAAVAFMREGRADIEMKGKMPSTEYLLPIMHPIDGLLPGDALLSEVTVFYYPDQNRLMFATDCALNISPTLKEKEKLIRNAADLAGIFGFEKVKVAVISALESVNPAIPSTLEARDLASMDWGENIIVAGPFALDNALDEATARDKGITNEVAGRADILLMPDICAGNVFHKCIHYFGHIQNASIAYGTSKPIVFTSRSDSAEQKYFSILTAILQSYKSS